MKFPVIGKCDFSWKIFCHKATYFDNGFKEEVGYCIHWLGFYIDFTGVN